jgi:hypothetical protein
MLSAPSPHTHTHTHTLSLSLSLCVSLCTWRVLLQRGLLIRKPSSLDPFSSASCCCYNIQIWTIETTVFCAGLKPAKSCKPRLHSISLSLSLSSRRPFSRVSRVRLFSRLVSSSPSSEHLQKIQTKHSTKTTRLLFLQVFGKWNKQINK